AIRLAIAKKGGAVPAVTYEEAIQEALCFGWIDSTATALAEGRYLLRMGPRKPGSGWSAVNKRRIEALIADGRMRPPGLAAIEAAEANGSGAETEAGRRP